MSAPEWGKERDWEGPTGQDKPKSNFENSEKKPMLILVGGGTSSGKTTLAKKINEKIGASIISTDRFYEGDEVFKKTTEIDFNFNKPESVNKNLLIFKVKDLLAGKDILTPKVTFEEKYAKDGSRTAKLTKVNDQLELKASKVIIIEGCHALQFPELREMADLKIFIDNSDDFRLMLKIMRSPYYKELEGKSHSDKRNFGRSREEDKNKRFVESIMDGFDTWQKATKPSENKYVLPTKKWADLVIPGSSSWEEFEYGLDKVVNLINLYFQNKEEFKKKLKESKPVSSESKIEDLEKQLQKTERERRIYWMVGGEIILFFGIIVLFLIRINQKKRKKKK